MPNCCSYSNAHRSPLTAHTAHHARGFRPWSELVEKHNLAASLNSLGQFILPLVVIIISNLLPPLLTGLGFFEGGYGTLLKNLVFRIVPHVHTSYPLST